MQGFPWGMVLPADRYVAWGLLGNAIPPPMAALGLALPAVLLTGAEDPIEWVAGVFIRLCTDSDGQWPGVTLPISDTAPPQPPVPRPSQTRPREIWVEPPSHEEVVQLLRLLPSLRNGLVSSMFGTLVTQPHEEVRIRGRHASVWQRRRLDKYRGARSAGLLQRGARSASSAEAQWSD